MYILAVHFSQTPEVVAPEVEAHGVWVKKYFDEGIFLAAGPKKSKLGGAILVSSIEKKKLLKILAEDSYVKADVADYQIIDIDCKLAAQGFEKLIGC